MQRLQIPKLRGGFLIANLTAIQIMGCLTSFGHLYSYASLIYPLNLEIVKVFATKLSLMFFLFADIICWQI